MHKLGIFLRLVYAEWASLVTGAFSAILIVLGLGVSIASAFGVQIPSESTIQIATWALAAVCGGGAAYSVWAHEHDKKIELENKLAAKKSDIAIGIHDGLAYEELFDEEGLRLPPTKSFVARLTNKGEKFLEKCQICFGMGIDKQSNYPTTKYFELRPGETKNLPILRVKDVAQRQRNDQDDRHALLYILRGMDGDWKITRGGPALCVPPGLHQLSVFSADTGAATIDVELSKSDQGWNLREVHR